MKRASSSATARARRGLGRVDVELVPHACPLQQVVIVGNCGRALKRHRSRSKAFWTWAIEGVTFTVRAKRKRSVVVELNEDQQVTITVNPKNRRGGPGAIDGDVVWAVSDPSAGAITVDEASANKRTATFTGIAGEGVRPADIMATFDGKEGTETTEFVLVGQVVVKDADNSTVVAEMEFGAVTDQP